ncbi:MAG: hypothetical protein ACPGU1_11120 [Myxococcota bacterium]
MVRAVLTPFVMALSSLLLGLLIYAASVEHARVISEVSGADQDVIRAFELVTERGAIGYLGG